MQPPAHAIMLSLATAFILWGCDNPAPQQRRSGMLSTGGCPPPGHTILMVGQDTASINAYLATVDAHPAGVMLYTDIQALSGLLAATDDGGAIRHADAFAQDPRCAHSALQLAVWMVDNLQAVIAGDRDRQIDTLAMWLNGIRQPLYLRIGYEFDGPWNHYEPAAYAEAYRYIVDRLRAAGVSNVAYIWHSAAVPLANNRTLDDWYPGDDYVDWVGISVFRQFDGSLGSMADIERVCRFAEQRQLPIGIVEATPYGGIDDTSWERWFAPLFRLIEEHDIRMLSYINADWDSQRMWQGQGWGDTRLQMVEAVRQRWLHETAKPRYLHASNAFFKQIGYDGPAEPR